MVRSMPWSSDCWWHDDSESEGLDLFGGRVVPILPALPPPPPPMLLIFSCN